MYPIISITICYFLLPFTIYHNCLLYCNLLPSLFRSSTWNAKQNNTHPFRQAIYYSLLSESGGNWAGSHRCSLLYFDSAVTIAHVVLISPGSVYYSCSQHLYRTGSSYQYTKTDLDLLIKIAVILESFSDNP